MTDAKPLSTIEYETLKANLLAGGAPWTKRVIATIEADREKLAFYESWWNALNEEHLAVNHTALPTRTEILARIEAAEDYVSELEKEQDLLRWVIRQNCDPYKSSPEHRKLIESCSNATPPQQKENR